MDTQGELTVWFELIYLIVLRSCSSMEAVKLGLGEVIANARHHKLEMPLPHLLRFPFLGIIFCRFNCENNVVHPWTSKQTLQIYVHRNQKPRTSLNHMSFGFPHVFDSLIFAWNQVWQTRPFLPDFFSQGCPHAIVKNEITPYPSHITKNPVPQSNPTSDSPCACTYPRPWASRSSKPDKLSRLSLFRLPELNHATEALCLAGLGLLLWLVIHGDFHRQLASLAVRAANQTA